MLPKLIGQSLDCTAPKAPAAHGVCTLRPIYPRPVRAYESAHEKADTLAKRRSRTRHAALLPPRSQDLESAMAKRPAIQLALRDAREIDCAPRKRPGAGSSDLGSRSARTGPGGRNEPCCTLPSFSDCCSDPICSWVRRECPVTRGAASAWPLVLAFTGASQCLKTSEMMQMVPARTPGREWVIYLTGGLESRGAAALVVTRLRRTAGACLILFLIAVFPANVLARRSLRPGSPVFIGSFGSQRKHLSPASLIRILVEKQNQRRHRAGLLQQWSIARRLPRRGNHSPLGLKHAAQPAASHGLLEWRQ
jgi:uncharacterized membrane protein